MASYHNNATSSSEASKSRERERDEDEDEDEDEGEGEEDWEDAEPDREEIQVVSLFDDTLFPTAKSMLDYCKERYKFDFISIRDRHSQ